jgi:hypothetical protein
MVKATLFTVQQNGKRCLKHAQGKDSSSETFGESEERYLVRYQSDEAEKISW